MESSDSKDGIMVEERALGFGFIICVVWKVLEGDFRWEEEEETQPSRVWPDSVMAKSGMTRLSRGRV